jgi:uncharacterized protein YigE (DUF2233 family)
MVEAATCRDETSGGNAYIVCSFDPAETDPRMYWRNAAGEPYRTFPALADDLARQGLQLIFAMNAGMYQADHSPLGLYIENGNVLKQINNASVDENAAQIPNFYKKPNGVFFVSGNIAGVMETEAFMHTRPESDFATQSGPMLVIDDVIHPMFIDGSNARRPRNGVGITDTGEVHFVMTRNFVNFHDFARFFRDYLGCDNALYLDGGSAPGLYAPVLNRIDPPGHGGYGPIIAVVE